MYTPTFLLILDIKNFPTDDMICLGNQLIAIVNALKADLPSHDWYGANAITLNEIAVNYGINTFFLRKIGSDETFIKLCNQVPQFLSGVFIAIDSINIMPLEEIEVDTEDEQFRSLKIENVLIEIRAFDTSFFEIFSDNEKIIETLEKKFGQTRER